MPAAYTRQQAAGEERPCEHEGREGYRIPTVHDGLTKAGSGKTHKKDIKHITHKAKLSIQVPMQQHQFDAMMSLAFDCGGSSKFPKLMSKLNANACKVCCDEFADITNAGEGGLVKRRQAEMNMFRNKIDDSTH